MNTTNTLYKYEMLGRSVNLKYDADKFSAMSFDRRRSQKNKEYYRALSEKTADEAYRWLQLAMHWKD